MEHRKPLKVVRYIYLKSTDSTNQYAQLLSSKSKPEGIICIYTAFQTDGRGQIGRNWYSGQDKNLTLSYLVPCAEPVNKHFTINRALSLALVDMCSTYLDTSRLTIKWPNDIYFDDKKLGGLLIQNIIRGEMIQNSILGVGLNVNEENFPGDLPNPVSMKIISGQNQALMPMMLTLSRCLELRLGQLNKDVSQLYSQYHERLYLRDRKSSFYNIKTRTRFDGILTGVSEEGKLLIRQGDELDSFNFREIKFDI